MHTVDSTVTWSTESIAFCKQAYLTNNTVRFTEQSPVTRKKMEGKKIPYFVKRSHAKAKQSKMNQSA